MYRPLLLLTALCLFTESCLITNCPRGGKRSLRPAPGDPDCRRCGPNLEGRCVGKTVCCGPRIGCLIGTPAVLGQCAAEPHQLQAMRGGQRCSIGVCLADGVCCSPEGCKMDMSCEVEQSVDACSLTEQLVNTGFHNAHGLVQHLPELSNLLFSIGHFVFMAELQGQILVLATAGVGRVLGVEEPETN